MIYAAALMAHSWLRWAVLAAGIVALARSISAWRSKRGWTPGDDRAAVFFTSSLDLQMLIGLVLYFWASPMMGVIRDHLDVAMRDGTMRYWLVEHPLGMVIAIALAHVGRARVRKATDPRRKHRLVMIFFGLALVALAASHPWPGMATGRPLFRSWP